MQHPECGYVVVGCTDRLGANGRADGCCCCVVLAPTEALLAGLSHAVSVDICRAAHPHPYIHSDYFLRRACAATGGNGQFLHVVFEMFDRPMERWSSVATVFRPHEASADSDGGTSANSAKLLKCGVIRIK